MSHVIIGVHGLANKPPQAQHEQDWVAAIKEGLERNCSLCGPPVNYKAVHWAHVNYRDPLIPDPEPYIPTPAGQPIKTYRDGWLDEIVSYVSKAVIDRITKEREWLGIDPITQAVLNRKLTDLGTYYENAATRCDLRDIAVAQ